MDRIFLQIAPCLLSELEGPGEEARGKSGVAAGTQPMEGGALSIRARALKGAKFSSSELRAPSEGRGVGTKPPGRAPLSPRPPLGLFAPAPRGDNLEGAERSGPSCPPLPTEPPFPRL